MYSDYSKRFKKFMKKNKLLFVDTAISKKKAVSLYCTLPSGLYFADYKQLSDDDTCNISADIDFYFSPINFIQNQNLKPDDISVYHFSNIHVGGFVAENIESIKILTYMAFYKDFYKLECPLFTASTM